MSTTNAIGSAQGIDPSAIAAATPIPVKGAQEGSIQQLPSSPAFTLVKQLLSSPEFYLGISSPSSFPPDRGCHYCITREPDSAKRFEKALVLQKGAMEAGEDRLERLNNQLSGIFNSVLQLSRKDKVIFFDLGEGSKTRRVREEITRIALNEVEKGFCLGALPYIFHNIYSGRDCFVGVPLEELCGAYYLSLKLKRTRFEDFYLEQLSQTVFAPDFPVESLVKLLELLTTEQRKGFLRSLLLKADDSSPERVIELFEKVGYLFRNISLSYNMIEFLHAKGVLNLFRHFTQLYELELHGVAFFPEWGIKDIPLGELRKLVLTNYNFQEGDAFVMRNLRHLRVLKIESGNFDNSVARELAAGAVNLKELLISRCDAFSELSLFEGCRDLRSINVPETGVDDKELERLDVPNLIELNVNKCRISDFRAIAKFTSLLRLNVSSTALNKEGLVLLCASLQKLQLLNIEDCPVDDLKGVSTPPQLRKLYLTHRGTLREDAHDWYSKLGTLNVELCDPRIILGNNIKCHMSFGGATPSPRFYSRGLETPSPEKRVRGKWLERSNSDLRSPVALNLVKKLSKSRDEIKPPSGNEDGSDRATESSLPQTSPQ